MKFTTFTLLLIGASFAQANDIDIVGSLKGLLELIPTLVSAAHAVTNFGEANKALGNVLNNTKCASTGPSEAAQTLAAALNVTGGKFIVFGGSYKNERTENGQLNLLGNLSQITSAGQSSVASINDHCEDLRNLADYINTNGFSQADAQTLAGAFEKIADGLDGFNEDFGQFENPSQLILFLSLEITGFNAGEYYLTKETYALANAAEFAVEYCGYTNELPSSIIHFGKAAGYLYELGTRI